MVFFSLGSSASFEQDYECNPLGGNFSFANLALPAPNLVVAPSDGAVTSWSILGGRRAVAKKKLDAGECKLARVSERKGVTGKTGKVVKQKPRPGKVLMAGSKVSVRLG